MMYCVCIFEVEECKTTWQNYTGMQMAGGEFVGFLTRELCIDLCAADNMSHCVAVQFRSTDGYCIVHRLNTDLDYMTPDDDRDIYVMIRCNNTGIGLPPNPLINQSVVNVNVNVNVKNIYRRRRYYVKSSNRRRRRQKKC